MKMIFALLLVLALPLVSVAQHDTRWWLNFNAGWGTIPDTQLGGVQFTVNPNKLLISAEFMFDESSVSTGVNTDILAFHLGYVFNDPESKFIYYGQLGPSSVKQYTVDCLLCDPYNRKQSAGVAGEIGASFRPFTKAPFGIGCRAIFNINGVQNYTAFVFNFCVVRL